MNQTEEFCVWFDYVLCCTMACTHLWHTLFLKSCSHFALSFENYGNGNPTTFGPFYSHLHPRKQFLVLGIQKATSGIKAFRPTPFQPGDCDKSGLQPASLQGGNQTPLTICFRKSKVNLRSLIRMLLNLS